jgi:hypothetical protein
MAYKYKLNELSSDVLSKIGTFIKDNPKVEYIRKEFVQTPANTDESEKLDFVLQGTLEKRGGFTPLDIEKYMDFLYTERNNNVGGEGGDTPINEVDPLEDKFADLLARFKKEDEEMGEPKSDSNAKNTFKQTVKEMVMTKLKEGKPCWKGYEQVGMKEKNGKQVPNCVPKK